MAFEYVADGSGRIGHLRDDTRDARFTFLQGTRYRPVFHLLEWQSRRIAIYSTADQYWDAAAGEHFSLRTVLKIGGHFPELGPHTVASYDFADDAEKAEATLMIAEGLLLGTFGANEYREGAVRVAVAEHNRVVIHSLESCGILKREGAFVTSSDTEDAAVDSVIELSPPGPGAPSPPRLWKARWDAHTLWFTLRHDVVRELATRSTYAATVMTSHRRTNLDDRQLRTALEAVGRELYRTGVLPSETSSHRLILDDSDPESLLRLAVHSADSLLGRPASARTWLERLPD